MILGRLRIQYPPPVTLKIAVQFFVIKDFPASNLRRRGIILTEFISWYSKIYENSGVSLYIRLQQTRSTEFPLNSHIIGTIRHYSFDVQCVSFSEPMNTGAVIGYPGVWGHMPPNTKHAHDKYLWNIICNFSQSTGYHSLMMDPLWSETCWSIF
jgi:hypothetical protein